VHSKDCLFCGIAARSVKADVVLENGELLAFRDIRPQAPTHVLIIPRKHVPTMNDVTAQDAPLVGKLLLAAQSIARSDGISERGYRLVFNCNRDAGQTVAHLHLHLLGGRSMSWPPG